MRCDSAVSLRAASSESTPVVVVVAIHLSETVRHMTCWCWCCFASRLASSSPSDEACHYAGRRWRCVDCWSARIGYRRLVVATGAASLRVTRLRLVCSDLVLCCDSASIRCLARNLAVCMRGALLSCVSKACAPWLWRIAACSVGGWACCMRACGMRHDRVFGSLLLGSGMYRPRPVVCVWAHL